VPGIHHPAFDADAEVTVEKVFEVRATAPSVIRLQVAIILPLVSGEHVSAPQTEVKLVIRVPLRAGRRYHLLRLLSGIDFRASKSSRGDRGEAQQAEHQSFHFISPFG
jgi:hypothetical protein